MENLLIPLREINRSKIQRYKNLSDDQTLDCKLTIRKKVISNLK